MGTPCAARGSINEARTPVWVKGNGPSSLKQIHGNSHFALSGACSAEQTIDNSSPVLVIDTKDAEAGNCGGAASEGKRQTAKLPASWRNFSFTRVNGSGGSPSWRFITAESRGFPPAQASCPALAGNSISRPSPLQRSSACYEYLAKGLHPARPSPPHAQSPRLHTGPLCRETGQGSGWPPAEPATV